MAGERRPPSWLPWALCWTSIAILVASVVLGVAFPEDADGGASFAVIGGTEFLLVPVVGALIALLIGLYLLVAAVFNPARRRLQAVVDRRFDRARYDAARAVDAFAARLRDQVDLDQVTAGLRDTVVTTVAPTHVAVWLRVPSRTGGI